MVSLPPSARLLQAFSSRITTRLRAALTLVAVIICAAGLGIALQMQTILSTPVQLNNAALPMLTIAQRIERDLNGIFLSMDMLQQEDAPLALDALEAEVSEKVATVATRLAELRRLGISPPPGGPVGTAPYDRQAGEPRSLAQPGCLATGG